MSWYLAALRRFADFRGRARRREYWSFFVGNVLVGLALGFVDALIQGTAGAGVGVLGLLFVAMVVVPGLAASVRRLHDTGRSGWWLLVALVPILGPLSLLAFYLQDGDPGPNRFGPSPKRTLASAA